MTLPGRVRPTIAPLDPATHDRSGFSSGVASVDRFLQLSANKLSRADNLRVFVMAEASGDLIGYYAINAHFVDYEDLPARYARTRPGHGMLPAAFISMIGVDMRFQGQGYGGVLLVDCLQKIVRAAEFLGIAVVMLDVLARSAALLSDGRAAEFRGCAVVMREGLDCGDPAALDRRTALYTRYGFKPLARTEGRLYLPLATARAIVGETT